MYTEYYKVYKATHSAIEREKYLKVTHVMTASIVNNFCKCS